MKKVFWMFIFENFIKETMFSARTAVVCFAATQRDNSLIPPPTLINTLFISSNAIFNAITQTHFLHFLIKKTPLKIVIQGNNQHIFL